MANQSSQLILTVQNGPQADQVFRLTEGSHLIGRTAGNPIHLSDPTISKQHARITVQASGTFIEDLGSSNGTFVNGQQITASTWLKSGDTVQVGTTVQLSVGQPGTPNSVADLGHTYIPASGASAQPTSDFSLMMQQGPQPGQSFPLALGSLTIGRTSDNQITIAESTISKQHARLTVQANGVFIQDLGSSNGTFVNGQRISSPTPLHGGDTVQVGTSVVLGVRGPGGAAAAATAPAGSAKKGVMGVVMALVILLVLGGVGAAAWFVVQSQTAEDSSDSVAPATAEPTPTQTATSTPVPAVAMDFSVDKTTVQLGRCTTLRWKVENAKEVRLDGERVSEEGTHKACPQEATKTYRLTALSLDGETEEQAVTLTVPPTPAPPPGVEIEFIADQSTVNYGDCTTLRWQVKNANEVRRETEKVALVGSEQVCPTEPGNTYTLLVQTLDGENVEQTVSIVVPPTPVPTATPLPPTATSRPQPQNPIIDKFIADQNSLNQGSCTTLRWQVRNAQVVRLDGNSVANQGSQRVCPTASTNTYNLVATGGGGGSTQSSLTISVNAPTPTPAIIYVQPSPVYVQPPPPPSGPPSINICGKPAEGICYVFQWNIQNVKEIYFDGEGVTGQGSRKVCDPDAQPGDRGNLRIVHLDGRVENINSWPPCN